MWIKSKVLKADPTLCQCIVSMQCNTMCMNIEEHKDWSIDVRSRLRWLGFVIFGMILNIVLSNEILITMFN